MHIRSLLVPTALVLTVGCHETPKPADDAGDASRTTTLALASQTVGSAGSSTSSTQASASSSAGKDKVHEQQLLDAMVGRKQKLRIYFERQDDKIRFVSASPDGLSFHVLHGDLTDNAFHLAEKGAAGKTLVAITGKRDGDAFKGEWQEDKKTSPFYAAPARAGSFKVKPKLNTKWVGSIGNIGRVRAKFDLDEASINGVYRYARSTSEMTLKGKLDPNGTGKVHLDESYDSKVTGDWEGALLSENVIAGRWFSPDKSRSYLFTLEHTDTYPEIVALWDRIKVSPEEHHVEANKHCYQDVTIARINGMTDIKAMTADNTIVGKLFQTPEKPSDCDTAIEDMDNYTSQDYSVSWQKKPFVQLTITNEGYTGGAHGFGSLDCHVIDLEKSTPIDLHKFVKNKAKLHEFVNKELRRAMGTDTLGDVGFFNEDVPVNDTTTLCLAADHVEVVYQQYEVAAYATGMPQVDIPAAQYDTIFDTKSAIGAVLFGK